MTRFFALPIALALLVGTLAPPAHALDITARSALVETAQGRILYARNANECLPMASTTKVMTALLCIEKGGLNQVVTISPHAASIPPSNLELQAGEKFRVKELLYGMLLHSANDAAVALAEHYAGSEANFARMMTRRAHELGAIHTRFANPNGLPCAGHYTTVKDLAIIMRAALANPTFRQIAETQQITLRWPGYHYPRHLVNINRFLTQYAMPVVGKTGFTDAAMQCYVGTAMAKKPLVTIALLGSDNLWGDARTLLNYGLTHMHRAHVAHARPAIKIAAVPHGRYIYSQHKPRFAHYEYRHGYYRYRAAYVGH